MAATSPNPSNLLLLAALGIAAYWLVQRAQAAPVVVRTQPRADPKAERINAVSGLVNVVGGLVGRFTGGSGGAVIGGIPAGTSADVADYGQADNWFGR